MLLVHANNAGRGARRHTFIVGLPRRRRTRRWACEPSARRDVWSVGETYSIELITGKHLHHGEDWWSFYVPSPPTPCPAYRRRPHRLSEQARAAAHELSDDGPQNPRATADNP